MNTTLSWFSSLLPWEMGEGPSPPQPFVLKLWEMNAGFVWFHTSTYLRLMLCMLCKPSFIMTGKQYDLRKKQETRVYEYEGNKAPNWERPL